MPSITLNTGIRRRFRQFRDSRRLRRAMKQMRKRMLRDSSTESKKQLLMARHRYASWLVRGNSPPLGEMPAETDIGLEIGEWDLPEIDRDQLTVEVMRKAILTHGALLVRGLVDPERAGRFAAGIDAAYASRESKNGDDLYDPFLPEEPYGPIDEFRPWIEQSGGLLAVDCPTLHAEMLEFFIESGLDRVADSYLGGPAVISAHKTTLRKVQPGTTPGWHQDGAFMGEVRSLNLWLALSRCGDIAPGMDVLPRRLDDFVETGGEGTAVANQVSQEDAEKAAKAAGCEIVRPVFNPGDALIFDEMFLHATAADGPMTKPRYAIESWFFTPAALPPGYVPVAI